MASVLQPWLEACSMQMQAVICGAVRGHDGHVKETAAKHLVRALRATCLVSARTGQPLAQHMSAGDYMRRGTLDDAGAWADLIARFLREEADACNVHWFSHFMQGAQVCAYMHPDFAMRVNWGGCYRSFASYLHLQYEPIETFMARLDDFGRWTPAHGAIEHGTP